MIIVGFYVCTNLIHDGMMQHDGGITHVYCKDTVHKQLMCLKS